MKRIQWKVFLLMESQMETSTEGPNYPQCFRVSCECHKKISLGEIWRLLFLIMSSFEAVKG